MFGRKISQDRFILAASAGDLATVSQYIDENGANPVAINVIDKYDGGTALSHAAGKGHADVVRVLLAAQPGIAINAANQYDGYTALILAADDGHTDVVRLLLAQPGIAINAANRVGDTALILAAAKDHTEIVRLLLEAGADPTLKNKNDKTAEMLTKKGEICTALVHRRINIKEQLELRLAQAEKYGVSIVLTNEEKSVKEQLDKEKQDMQNAADLKCDSIISEIDFLIEHLNEIEDLRLLPKLIMRFSELISSLTENNKKFDQYSRALLRVAANRGDDIAKHIVDHFKDADDDEMEKEIEKEIAADKASSSSTEKSKNELNVRSTLFGKPLPSTQSSTVTSQVKNDDKIKVMTQ